MTKLYAQRKDVFDINKVTVVGSPTITSDGIISDTGNNNGVNTPIKLADIANKKWDIITPYFSLENRGAGIIDGDRYGYGAYFNFRILNDKVYLYLRVGDANNNASTNMSFAIPEKEYQVKISFDGQAQYYLFYRTINNNTWIIGATYTATTENKNPYLSTTDVFISLVKTYYQTKNIGSFDLKQFKIYVDGELVYSPTKPVYALERRKPKVWNKGQFTIVGNPSISDSGVASGFSTANVIRTPEILWGNSLKASIRFNLSSLPHYACLIGGVATNKNSIRLTVQPNGELRLNVSDDGSTNYTVVNNLTCPAGTISLNNWYDVDVVFDGVSYKIYVNGNLLAERASVKLPYNAVLQIGSERSDANYGMLQGQIDLKQFKIYTNNNLVFDGGAETYVYDASKFTVVGSPTITEDGVASGFSSGNYITTENKFSIDISKSFEAYLSLKGIKYNPSLGDTGVIRFRADSNSRFDLRYNGQKFFLVSNGTGNASESTGIKYFSYDRDMDVKIIFGLNGSTFYCKIKKSYNENWLDLKTTTINIDDTFTNAFIQFGLGWGNYMTSETGSIDLSQFSITVDGKEVFTGAKEKYYAMRGGM